MDVVEYNATSKMAQEIYLLSISRVVPRTMTRKFNTTGNVSIGGTRSPEVISKIERFTAGAGPMTTITVQILGRLKRAFKRRMVDQDTTMKGLLIEILESYFVENK
jgi:uncharacterized pyridoxal phosphate-containing UPF0001 family protein